MFCDHCSTYVSNKRTNCPTCGHALDTSKFRNTGNYQANSYPDFSAYYCEMCADIMQTPICPLHQTKGILVSDLSSHSMYENQVSTERSAITPPLNGGRVLPGGKNPQLSAPTRNGAPVVSPEIPETQARLEESPKNDIPHSQARGPAQPFSQAPFPETPFDQEEHIPEPEISNQKSGPGSFFYALTIILLIAGSVALNWQQLHAFILGDNDTRSDLYSQAETLYISGKYLESLALFTSYKQQYPNDPSIQSIDQKIDLVKKKIMTRESQINALFTQATAAFHRQEYVGEDESDAFFYLQQLLVLDPENRSAVAMLDQIADKFLAEAMLSTDQRNYPAAIKAYQNILKIRPNNVFALNQLSQIQDVLSEKSTADSGSKQLSEKQGNATNSTEKVVEKAQQQTTLSSEESKESSSADSTSIVESNQQTQQETSRTIAAEAQLVIEALIDGGGKREYVYRTLPSTPDSLRLAEVESIRAKCIIGIDGTVEYIKLAERSEYEVLNQLAMETIRDYRYQPATYLGKPARFKCTEVIVFQ